MRKNEHKRKLMATMLAITVSVSGIVMEKRVCAQEDAVEQYNYEKEHFEETLLFSYESIATTDPDVESSPVPSILPTSGSQPGQSASPSPKPSATPSAEASAVPFSEQPSITPSVEVSAAPFSEQPSTTPETPQATYTPPSLAPVETPTKAPDTLVWDGKIDTKWEGRGTKASPYLIYTPQEFAGMLMESKDYQGNYYKLMNDIDLGGKPLRANDPDGDWGGYDWGKLDFYTFYGIFDGNYHIITGFYQKTDRENINTSSTSMAIGAKIPSNGIFGRIDKIASVSNVTVCGRTDCGAAFTDQLYGVMKNCTSYVDCYGEYGGMVAEALGSSSIQYCYNYGNVVVTEYAAGIVGHYYSAGTISNCVNFGNIQQSGTSYYEEEICAGGIIGYCEKNGLKLTDCVNRGAVDSSADAGGIIGHIGKHPYDYTVTISRCYNSGDITGGNRASGIFNKIYYSHYIVSVVATVENCVNKGTVISNTGSAAGIVFGGGGQLSKSYAISRVEGAYSYGLGYIGFPSISNCYYVGNAENLSTNDEENIFTKHWTTFPEDELVDINGGDFDYFTVNDLSKCQNGFPVLSWEAESFNVDKLQHFSVTENSIGLVWTLVPRATGYEIYRCGAGGKMELLDTINTNRYIDEDLEPETQYQYKVRAYLTENGYTFYGEFTDVLQTSTLAEYILGDIDGDWAVTLTDAQMVLKAALKIDAFDNTQIRSADVDGNGVVELSDAQIILKVALKITSISR